MLSFKILSLMYLRYFMIVLIALSGFMIGFDLMDKASELPSSANLFILYLFYKTLYAIDMMLPISLVFGFIATMSELIRSNALVAYYAVGYTKKSVFAPFFALSFMMISLYIALHATSFSRANEYAENLRETSQFVRPSTDLFFTYEGKYIYFGSLYPMRQEAENIRIFSFNEGNLTEILNAPKAYYADNYWNIPSGNMIITPLSHGRDAQGVKIEEVKNARVLENFRPKILDQVYEGKINYSISDALDAMRLLENQNVDKTKVKTALYRIFFSPWFAVALMGIFFVLAPINTRFFNLSLFSFGAILITLLTWGILFALGELAGNKTLSPEYGVILPIIVIYSISLAVASGRLRRVWIKSRQN